MYVLPIQNGSRPISKDERIGNSNSLRERYSCDSILKTATNLEEILQADTVLRNWNFGNFKSNDWSGVRGGGFKSKRNLKRTIPDFPVNKVLDDDSL